MKCFKRRKLLKKIDKLLQEEAYKQSISEYPDYYHWVTLALRYCKIKGGKQKGDIAKLRKA